MRSDGEYSAWSARPMLDQCVLDFVTQVETQYGRPVAEEVYSLLVSENSPREVMQEALRCVTEKCFLEARQESLLVGCDLEMQV